MKEFSSDQAVSSKKNDRFQRYGFAKRIAQTIIQRKSEDCLTIGIYGEWGEGKTSVLNFIERELSEHKKDIVFFKFNPWRFGEEDKLLVMFFELLANKLGKSASSKSDKLKKAVKKYSKIVAPVSSIIPGFGGAAEKIVEGVSDILGEKDIEDIKERVSKILRESNTKIVVAIDDIDRLDKDEIYAVLKLVKLTAGFSNTTYLLSFDEKMVASAIGERFGGGREKAGSNFLEKIIHVPLDLPKAQPFALKQYCYNLIEKVIGENGIKISEQEIGRFAQEFSQNILIRLNNPRLAVRYSNSVAFLLPLLANEVNHVDLLLIEALKTFYPKHYDFVKSRPDFFIGGYSDLYTGYVKVNKKKKVSELSSELKLLSEGFNENEKLAIKNLLTELFPRLNEAFSTRQFPANKYQEWYNNKKICSPKYFDRYFSYTVIEGEISDVKFTELIDFADSEDIEATVSKLQLMIVEASYMRGFMYKLEFRLEELNWRTKTTLIFSILELEELIPEEDSLFFGIGTVRKEFIILTYDVVKSQNNQDDRFHFAEQVFNKAKSYELAYDINNEFRFRVKKEDEIIFSDKEFSKFAFLLLNKAKKCKDDIPFFKVFSNRSGYLLRIWGLKRPKEFRKYLDRIFQQDGRFALDLLKSFTPLTRSNTHPEPYPGDFTESHYSFMNEGVDTIVIAEKLLENFTKSDSAQNVRFDTSYDESQTDENLIKQFLHWHNENSKA